MGTSAGVAVSGLEVAAAALALYAPHKMTSGASSSSGPRSEGAVTVDVLDKIGTVLDEYVTWQGDSEDAADSSSAGDLDQLAACYICGWDQDYSEGLAHDAWYPENSHAERHEYEPGPQETGEVVVSLYGSYELDGTTYCPAGTQVDLDEPCWALYAYWQHTRDAEEPFLDEIASGLTVQEAVDLAAKLGHGWPIGV